MTTPAAPAAPATPAAPQLRVLIAGGGSGGHVFPALAVAQALRAAEPAAGILFVGAEGLERELVPAHGFELVQLPAGRLKGATTMGRLRTLARLPPALLRARALLRDFAPQVVVGVGGYASGPLVAAAALARLPVLLLEQNAIPGLTNRLLARCATHVVVAFTEAARRLPAGRAALLGNPLRPELVAALQQPREPPGAGVGRSLLVLGGSQGARALNEAISAAAPRLAGALPALLITHQTGPADASWVAERYQRAGVAARVEPFIEDMAKAYRGADLVLSRAGATTIAELRVAGLPAVLVPYPHAADDHQTANGSELAQTGAALLLPQGALNPDDLAALLAALLNDPPRLASMSQAMRAAARPEAAAAVVRLIRALAAERR
ncbi:MAG: undecaprenyldiphospho-muramoylpentapeptide beta-N-acetylglucosaminyltransferase [Proteobacteria bacterium]|nr:undecaprenyldiphospho-muramoylpentapeptide beta-N-acetylglucosaminyltransferase [Pseudomonadota bacterium]